MPRELRGRGPNFRRGDSREAFSQGRPLEQGLAEQVETSSGGRKSQKALLWQRQ